MQPAPDWAPVYQAASRAEAELVRGRLEEHGIDAIVIDTGSSAYPPLAQAAVHVRRADVMRALHEVGKSDDA
ncbi:MAG TPA: DUF2007 domain-containing protein [Flavobacteriales bacterium]|nr:DUF2007 domain-containing protein [Flavobacteriales bacterium]